MPLVVIGEPVTDRKVGTVMATDVTVPEPPPGGAAHVPSARRKLVVPPPEAGVKPFKLVVNVFSNAVTCVAVKAVGVAALPVPLPNRVSAAIVGNWESVTCPES